MFGLLVLILVDELKIEKENQDRQKYHEPVLLTSLYNQCSQLLQDLIPEDSHFIHPQGVNLSVQEWRDRDAVVVGAVRVLLPPYSKRFYAMNVEALRSKPRHDRNLQSFFKSRALEVKGQ